MWLIIVGIQIDCSYSARARARPPAPPQVLQHDIQPPRCGLPHQHHHRGASRAINFPAGSVLPKTPDEAGVDAESLLVLVEGVRDRSSWKTEIAMTISQGTPTSTQSHILKGLSAVFWVYLDVVKEVEVGRK